MTVYQLVEGKDWYTAQELLDAEWVDHCCALALAHSILNPDNHLKGVRVMLSDDHCPEWPRVEEYKFQFTTKRR